MNYKINTLASLLDSINNLKTQKEKDAFPGFFIPQSVRRKNDWQSYTTQRLIQKAKADPFGASDLPSYFALDLWDPSEALFILAGICPKTHVKDMFTPYSTNNTICNLQPFNEPGLFFFEAKSSNKIHYNKKVVFPRGHLGEEEDKDLSKVEEGFKLKSKIIDFYSTRYEKLDYAWKRKIVFDKLNPPQFYIDWALSLRFEIYWLDWAIDNKYIKSINKQKVHKSSHAHTDTDYKYHPRNDLYKSAFEQLKEEKDFEIKYRKIVEITPGLAFEKTNGGVEIIVLTGAYHTEPASIKGFKTAVTLMKKHLRAENDNG